MGFTIEDMMTVSEQRYRMRMKAGRRGWSNSISWLIMIEDMTVLRNFSGKELAVTTGLGFVSEESQLALVRELAARHAAGLVINTGKYILEIPDAVARFCDENELPLLTVPWDVYLVDMIKDLSIRVFLQGEADEQISAALIRAIEMPEAQEKYVHELMPYFDTDGSFQVVLSTMIGLDKMDTVERRRIAYRMQLYLANLTHNGSFFYYNGNFVLVINAVNPEATEEILAGFRSRLTLRMPEMKVYVGVGSRVTDVTSLYRSYARAQAALAYAVDQEQLRADFDGMGVYRLLYEVPERELLHEMCEELLAPLIEYDRKHDAQYVETLEMYLKEDESIQAVADAMFTHRNTVLYRIRNIKNLLGCPLKTEEEKLPYRLACMIRRMYRDGAMNEKGTENNE